jgi:hypothetical protein
MLSLTQDQLIYGYSLGDVSGALLVGLNENIIDLNQLLINKRETL